MRPPAPLPILLLSLPLLAARAGAAALVPGLPPGPAAFADADREIDGLQERLGALRRETEPLLDALAKLEARYRDPAGFASASLERAALRERLTARADELRAGEQRFNELREQTQVQKVVLGLQKVMREGDVPPAAGAEFVRSNVRQDFAVEIQRFRERADAALRLDEEAYRAAEAQAELERRRGREVWALGAGAALFLAIVALLVENARLRRALRAQPQVPRLKADGGGRRT